MLLSLVNSLHLQTPLRPSSATAVKTVKLTIIYGNLFRKGAAPNEHKWKMTYDLDGDQDAKDCVKVIVVVLIRIQSMLYLWVLLCIGSDVYFL